MSDHFPNGEPPSPWEPPRPPQKSAGMPSWAKALLIVSLTVIGILVAIPLVFVGLLWFACSHH